MKNMTLDEMLGNGRFPDDAIGTLPEIIGKLGFPDIYTHRVISAHVSELQKLKKLLSPRCVVSGVGASILIHTLEGSTVDSRTRFGSMNLN